MVEHNNIWFSQSETYFLMLSKGMTGISWDDERAGQGASQPLTPSQLLLLPFSF
jgi:hypothetical protein